jgi:3-oxoacyl-[acyl-carrier protein] reductase
MELGLNGRTAIVCGASSGMGLAVSEALRAEGARVVMFARRADLLRREADRIGGLAVAGDVTVEEDVARLVAETLAAYGEIDVLVLNGGGPPPGPAVSVTPGALHATLDLLLTGHVRLVGACLEHLRAHGRGRIVAVQSSSVREPLPMLALSNAIRPGVVGWLKTLARELGPDGVTVNVVAPGRIDTDRLRQVYPEGLSDDELASIALRRMGTPQEIAAAVCFLASDAAAYVTGAVVPVDGGLTRSLL